jgi:alkylation response protein AidB-like acyl-CoA dehydrogenase
MNLDLTEDQIAVRDAVRTLCEQEFAPHAAAWDRDGEVPHHAIEMLAAQGSSAWPWEAWADWGDARTITMVTRRSRACRRRWRS